MSKYKLVPVKPTQEMIDAALKSDHAEISPRKIVEQDYKAMLAAAPDVQGEAVAYLRKDQLRQVQRMGPMLGEIADSPRVDRVPVYTAPQPATEAALLEAFVAETAAKAEAAELAAALDGMIEGAEKASWDGYFHEVPVTRAVEALAAYRKQGGKS